MKKFISLLTIFTPILILNSCLSLGGDGVDRPVKESASNKHSKKAVLFLRESGATVGDSYQVSITDYKTEFDSTAVGNTFTFDDDHGKASLYPGCIDFNWLSEDTVEINYDKNLRPFIQENNINGVTVIYKTK